MINDFLDLKPEQIYVDSQGACDYLKISKRTLQRWRDCGTLKYYQVNKVIRYKISDLDSFVNSFKMEPFNTKGGSNG